MNKIKLLTMVLCLLLSACATPYKPDGLLGGYSDMPLNQDTYKVSFRGNGCSSKEYVQNSLLRRCSQITLENNRRYFIVLDGATDIKRRFDTAPTIIRANHNGYMNGCVYGNSFNSDYNGSSFATISGGGVQEIDSYTSTIYMKTLRNNKKYPEAFDALLIMQSWQPKKTCLPFCL